MGTIVCQSCGSIIEYFELNRVKTLYGVCNNSCRQEKTETVPQSEKTIAIS